MPSPGFRPRSLASAAVVAVVAVLPYAVGPSAGGADAAAPDARPAACGDRALPSDGACGSSGLFGAVSAVTTAARAAGSAATGADRRAPRTADASAADGSSGGAPVTGVAAPATATTRAAATGSVRAAGTVASTVSTWTDVANAWKRARRDGNPGLFPTKTTTSTSTTSTSTTSTTTSTTTTTAPPSTTTTTTTPPPVTPATCLGPGARVVSGAQTARYKPVLTTATAVDARGATWLQVDDWPVSVTGTAPLCFSGGTITGTYPDTTPWSVFHSTGAFNVANPDSIVERLRVHDYGDGIRLREGASHWTVRDVEESYLHDDCVENDRLYTGAITDSLFDGCYVGFSARPESSDTTSDGRGHTVSITRSLVRLQPMPTVYKGPAPGTGGFFKWDDTGRSPSLSLHDNVFRADQLPNHGSLGLPDGYSVSCSGNVIVWLGSGPFPEAASWRAKCPDTVIVTSGATWDAAVAGWRATH